MIFKVILSGQARMDVRKAAGYYKKRSPQAAQKWLREFKKLQESLAIFPARFALSNNPNLTKNSYRVAFHYSHKVVFHVDEQSKTVYIAHVYHSARKPLELDEDIE